MNPIVQGWYADPEARFYEGKYYIYVTRSFTKYEDQMNIDAFSSADLIHWEKHEGIIDMSGYPYVHRAVWAPTIIEKNGKYYLMFATNDIHEDDEGGGLEIAVSDSPAGPFRNLIGTSLIGKIIYGAQPIDAHLFKDDDGTIYLYYGGWGHCNMAVMNETMDGFVPFEDGEIFKSITPDGYVEGPCMMKRNGVYHFMWSEGGWTNGTYHVASSHSLSPTDICKTGKTVLSSSEIANGPGHHGYLHVEGTEDDWLIVYHRRIIGDLEAGHRMLCIDRMTFDGDEIVPVIMT
ncbi:MAG: glycoside hydrolase family 43 protein [Clostridia bacterium]|nr:glycoside hydrolase family 43 protein [Clostridia bacterium]